MSDRATHLNVIRLREALLAEPANAHHDAHQEALRADLRQWRVWARGTRLQHPGAVILLRTVDDVAGVVGADVQEIADALALGPSTTEGDVREGLRVLERYPALLSSLNHRRYIVTVRGRRVLEVLDGVYDGLYDRPCRECREPLPNSLRPRTCPACGADHPATARYALA